jgi:hypothetical protein
LKAPQGFGRGETAPGFVLKAPQGFGRGETRFDDFEGHHAPRLFLLGFVDGAHAAFTQQANHAITADRGRASGFACVPRL